MKAAMIQPPVSDSLAQNLDQVLGLLDQAKEKGADLAVLPELWNTPFVNSAILAHKDDWKTIVPALQKKAAALKLWIVAGTIPVEENGKLFNRCLVFSDAGEISEHADKVHLLEVHTAKNDYFEADVFTPGNRFATFETPWGKCGILICFDTRFAEAFRLISEDLSVIFAPCGFNSSAGRRHFKPLMQTRALENEVFLIAVNPQKAKYSTYSSYGHSLAVDPDGQIICEMAENDALALADLDLEMVSAIRFRSPFWKCRRTDLYALTAMKAQNDPD